MKKYFILISFLSSVAFPQYTNPHFEASFIFTDNLNNSEEIILGYDAFGTDSLDPDLGEVIVPQVPPGYFGARFQLPADTSLYTLKDFRYGCGEPFYYEHLVDLSYASGSSTIDIDWQWSFELWIVHIIDPSNGQTLTTLESFFDSSYYSIPSTYEKIILGIQYDGPLSWPQYLVTSPDGGEIIEGGEVYTITWFSNHLVPGMSLEFSTDAGENWNYIVESISTNQNSYDWNVPLINSENCLIRIGDYPCAYDRSDSLFTITYPVNVEKESDLPTEFSLSQNYPNPFNPTTKIKYAIPQDVRGKMQEVSLKIYDVLGNEVATLVNEEKPAGNYEVEFNAEATRRFALTSGIYFYQLSAGNFIETKKMLLLK